MAVKYYFRKGGGAVSEDRKVVVMVTPEFLHDEDRNLFAARIRPLGLTGYGESWDAASVKIKRMFAAWVKGHRIIGDLEEWLEKSGLEWHWLDEYAGDMPVEMVQPAKPLSNATSANTTATNWHPIPEEVRIAA